MEEKKKKGFNVSYKLLILIPTVIFLIAVGILVSNYTSTGEWFKRSIELKGGTVISLDIPATAKGSEIETQLLSQGFNLKVKEISSLSGKSITLEIGDEDPQRVLEALSNMGIDTSNPTISKIGPSLGEAFWQQAQTGIFFAFVLMGIIVFVIFRKVVPSFAVITAALSDILVTLALMQVFGIELSLAGMAALLMLIGYSVDTDILLTTRLLKREGEMKEKLKQALKTGLTMTITTMGALTAIILVGISPVLTQIASVLMIGLFIDIINTWFQNSVILRWYCERKGI